MKSTAKKTKPGIFMEAKFFNFNPKAELFPHKIYKSVTFTSFAQNSFLRKKNEKENIPENRIFEITKELSKKENDRRNWSPDDRKYEISNKFIPSFKPITEKKGISEKEKKMKLHEKQKKNMKITNLNSDELDFTNTLPNDELEINKFEEIFMKFINDEESFNIKNENEIFCDSNNIKASFLKNHNNSHNNNNTKINPNNISKQKVDLFLDDTEKRGDEAEFKPKLIFPIKIKNKKIEEESQKAKEIAEIFKIMKEKFKIDNFLGKNNLELKKIKSDINDIKKNMTIEKNEDKKTPSIYHDNSFESIKNEKQIVFQSDMAKVCIYSNMKIH